MLGTGPELGMAPIGKVFGGMAVPKITLPYSNKKTHARLRKPYDLQ